MENKNSNINIYILKMQQKNIIKLTLLLNKTENCHIKYFDI